LSSDELALMAKRSTPDACVVVSTPHGINASTERGGYNDIWNTDLGLD